MDQDEPSSPVSPQEPDSSVPWTEDNTFQPEEGDEDLGSSTFETLAIEVESNLDVAHLQAEASIAQVWNPASKLRNVRKAKLMTDRPELGKAHLTGSQSFTHIICEGLTVPCLLDTGATCSVVGSSFLNALGLEWEDKLLPITNVNFRSCTSSMTAVGILPVMIIFPHTTSSVELAVEFVVMQDATTPYFILGNEWMTAFGFDITHSKSKYFTIGNEHKKEKFALLDKSSIMTSSMGIYPIEKSHALKSFIEHDLAEGKFNPSLTVDQLQALQQLLFSHKGAFASMAEPFGSIKGHLVKLTLTIDKPYPPALRKAAYPASPRAREELRNCIEELLHMGVLRKVGINEQVDITTPVVVVWQHGKARMVGDFRILNTYTEPDRYPMPRINESLSHLKNAKFITTMDVLKGFHQNVVHPNSRQYLRIICFMGIYEYLRMPFGIKNAPSHFQRMMDSEFHKELSEGWLIIYIDDIIIASITWEEHLSRLDRVLAIVINMGMKISLKKCNFCFSELKALGHIVSGLTLAID